MASDELEIDDYGFFGFDEAREEKGDPNVKPVLEAPGEVDHMRHFDSITLKWQSLMGQVVHSLKLEAMPASVGFANGFDASAQCGGKSAKVKNPLENNFGTINGLEPSTSYVFRMVATNEAGTTTGPVSVPISTLRYAPPRGDKSAWLYVLPDRKKASGVKSIGRRLSLRKFKPTLYFFVLEGALLTWFKEVRACICVCVSVCAYACVCVMTADNQAETCHLICVTGWCSCSFSFSFFFF